MIIYTSITEKGDRPINEDSLAVQCMNGNFCFLIADGLGGHNRGEVASGQVPAQGEDSAGLDEQSEKDRRAERPWTGHGQLFGNSGNNECSIWFSDGVQTIMVTELSDTYQLSSMFTWYFNESTHMILSRSALEKYKKTNYTNGRGCT